MRNSLKIRWFAILPVLAQPITPVNLLPDPTMKARMFPSMRTFYITVFYWIVVYVTIKEIRSARTKPSSILRHDSILLINGAIHRTLPTLNQEEIEVSPELHRQVREVSGSSEIVGPSTLLFVDTRLDPHLRLPAALPQFRAGDHRILHPMA